MSRPRRPGLRPLAAINVTPLVDVMLVLLIVFMVTAALERQGVPVDLPEGKGNALATEDHPVTVTIDRDNQLSLDQTPISRDQFAAELPALAAAGTELIFQADKSVSYGTFVEVVALVRASGIERLTIETEPPAP